MAKQATCQRYIYKIHSSRLRKSRWKLTLPLAEARRNDEIISLADSQVLRWIDELNGVSDAESTARAIKAEIRAARNGSNGVVNRRHIKKLYAQLDEVLFKPDYLCLIIDHEKDYYRACRGFSINGVKYARLLGTNGGIKNSTIVFVSERLRDELQRRIDNGRDMTKEMVPAKLEAYKALACSASIPVSMPAGILVVDDCETEFTADIIYLNDESDGEPVMEDRAGEKICMDASDGFGLMLPSLAAKWSAELNLDYVVSGVNTRFSWEKGMVFTFDFLDFAENVARQYMVRDAWGNMVDIRNVELILTTSMLKLWDSYESLDAYLRNCAENRYTFCVTKTAPRELENERTLNYQFIQSYDLSDEDIRQLAEPTMREIKEVLHGDRMKTVLFLKGMGLNERNISRLEYGIATAIMIDPRMMDDPYIQSSIYQAIQRRIDEAKVGVLNVHGNYSTISGDPYSLCQHMFGLEVTGLLKAGEIYNKYWSDFGAKELACFRAPMTCHNNIRKVHPNSSPEAAYWYRHIKTCTIFNSWDMATNSLNGADFDGDAVMLTDNPVLVGRLRVMPSLMCVQRKAKKVIVTEGDAIRANIDSFGDSIGKTTNWITSMFDVQAQFEKGSQEYEELDYRIKCGQLFQQNAIDKAKGIIAKPMPKEWYDWHSASAIEDPKKRKFYQSIVADKKPYFMRLIYPKLTKQYNTYIKNTNKSAMREFHMTVDELKQIPTEERTERQRDFLRYYDLKMPVSTHDCVMNRICRLFENEFDGYLGRQNKLSSFDYTIMKSDAKYTEEQYRAICRLYDAYNRRLQNYMIFASYERVDECDVKTQLTEACVRFTRECDEVCPNRFSLCNIVLDICYRKSSTKKFAWTTCGAEIIENLLNHNERTLCYPTLDPDGDILFRGERFSLQRYIWEECNEHCAE